jgi:hypothetical protein
MVINDLDINNLPNKEGKYLAKGIWGNWNEPKEIEVYLHPIKGLCCYSEDFGSEGAGVDDRYDCHVSVQFSGLEFISRTGDLK